MLEKKADMFLLDANDCRHHLLSVDSKINKDSKVLTLNEGIEKNSLEKIMGIETEINEINSYEVDFDIYKNAVKFIINQIQTVYKDDEIIVHEHLPVYEYLDSDGKLVHLKETAYYCENVNELLLSINEEIKKLLPRSHYIEFPNNVVCGENKWGISPLHYHSLYYEYGEEALKIILEKRDNEKELLNSLKNLYSLKFQRLRRVTGYIVGAVNGNVETGCEFGSTEVATNILIADDADESDYSKCLIVQLPKGDIRNALNLADNTDNYKKQVKISGSLETYFKAAGLKSVTEYEFTGVTGIESVNNESAEKVIYDLTGRRVETITKAGIYIVNGKKIIIK